MKTINNPEDFKQLITNNPIYIISEMGEEAWESTDPKTQIFKLDIDDQFLNGYPRNSTLYIHRDYISLIVDLFTNLHLVNFDGGDSEFYDFGPDRLLCILQCLDLMKDFKGINHDEIATTILTKAHTYLSKPDSDQDDFQLTYGEILNKFKTYI